MFWLESVFWPGVRSIFDCRRQEQENPIQSTMDVLPSGNIFRELQVVHDTGYFSAQPSLEDRWQQVCVLEIFLYIEICGFLSLNIMCIV